MCASRVTNAQVMKHHPMKGGGTKTGREQHSIYYPEDNVTEVIDLHQEKWRHIVTTVKTSYRGTVIRSSMEEGLQVHLDGGTVREQAAFQPLASGHVPAAHTSANGCVMRCCRS